jgi:hypothetical protein
MSRSSPISRIHNTNWQGFTATVLKEGLCLIDESNETSDYNGHTLTQPPDFVERTFDKMLRRCSDHFKQEEIHILTRLSKVEGKKKKEREQVRDEE